MTLALTLKIAREHNGSSGIKLCAIVGLGT
jgi:hypothetical protein